MILDNFTTDDDRERQMQIHLQQNNVVELFARKNDRAIKLLENAIKSLNKQIGKDE